MKGLVWFFTHWASLPSALCAVKTTWILALARSYGGLSQLQKEMWINKKPTGLSGGGFSMPLVL